MRKLTLILLPVLFITGLICTFHYLIIDFNKMVRDLGSLLWSGFILFSMFRMYIEGTFRKTNWVRGTYFAIAMIIVGSLFTIQHWPGGRVLLYFGCLLVAICYIIHFTVKASKSLFDWLKLVYVLTTAALIQMKMNHHKYLLEIMWTQTIIAIALIAVFYIIEWKGKLPAPPEVSEEDANVFRYRD
jgi:asparagine N-glycosylation enzyme membrane subunit Stt3